MSPQTLIAHVDHDDFVGMVLESQQLGKGLISGDVWRRKVNSFFYMELVVLFLFSQVKKDKLGLLCASDQLIRLGSINRLYGLGHHALGIKVFLILMLLHQAKDRLIVIGLGQELSESLGCNSAKILALLLGNETILLHLNILHALSMINYTLDICISGVERDLLIDIVLVADSLSERLLVKS